MSEFRKINLSAPYIGEDDINAVVEVLKTNTLSLGPKLVEFEEKFAEYVGTKYAVALNSGTSALHLAVKSLGIGPGDDVIVVPFSFVASSNCVLFEGATPVFVDIDPVTFNIDPKKIEEKITPKTKAIIPVDIFGKPCEKDEILAIAKKHNLHVIEDTAEAIGALYNNRQVGTFGDCGIFAFYPNKQMTTGEGGMLVTNNEKIYELCKSYRNQGRGITSDWHTHVRIGYNYRLSDINCALGISQLKKIDKILDMRTKVAEEYTKRLKDVPGIKIPIFSDDKHKVSWFVYIIQIENGNREDFMKELIARGIACSPYFSPIHLMKFYKEMGFKEGDYPVCEKISKTTLAIPFHTNMSIEDIEYVCKNIADIQNKFMKSKSKIESNTDKDEEYIV